MSQDAGLSRNRSQREVKEMIELFDEKLRRAAKGVEVKTGKDVVQTGPYLSDCCLVQIELQKHQMFPRCPKCMQLTLWEPTSPLTRRDKKAA